MHTDRNWTGEMVDILGTAAVARISAHSALLVRAIILQVIHLERAKSVRR